jgi:hypothetical protein
MNDGSNIVGIVLGEKGTGKTPFLIGDEKAGITGLAEGYLKRDMKMLILDTYDHPKYRHIPVIQPKQIHYWKKGLYRFFASDLEEMFVQIKKNLYNCAVGLEDCHKYLDQYLLENYLNEINIDSKNRNNDILYISHAWGWIPKDVYRIADVFEIFKSSEHPSVRKKELAGCYDRVLKTWEEALASDDKYFHKTVFK